MRCEDLVSIIIDYVEGSMDPRLREEFERHIGDCSSCFAFLETYKKTSKLTKDIKCHEIPADVQDRLKSFLKEKLHK